MGHKTKKSRSRSAKSGEFVTKEFAKANPETTVTETVKKAVKKSLIIFLLLCSSMHLMASKFYVSSDGNNAFVGSYAAPFLTVPYATNIAQNYDTVVIVGAVNSSEIAYLKLHTSVIGYDTNAKIVCSNTGAAALAYYSATIVNGSTSVISGIKFDGQNIAYGAIMSSRVGGMTIKGNTIYDFKGMGIHLYNPATTAPTCIGTIIYGNTITNCARYLGPGSFGNLWTMGQKDLIVRKNIVTASYLPGDSAGFVYKASHLENAKIDSNEFYVVNHNDGARWAFAIEINHSFGGNEINNNTLQGIVDISGHNLGKYTYDYCISIHDNLIGHPALTAYWQLGIILESYSYTKDIEIYNNTTRNVATALSVYHLNSNTFQNINYRNNLIYNVGRTLSGGSGYAINLSGNYTAATVRDFNIDNNTIDAGQNNGTAVTALAFSGAAKVRNLKFRNNIIKSFPNAYILTPSTPLTGSIDTLVLQNNVVYNCGNANNPKWYGIIPTHLTNEGTVKDDPMLEPDYTLQELSPAINAGIDIGLPFSGTAPDIGAFEYLEAIRGIRSQLWTNIPGTQLSYLTRNRLFPLSPTSETIIQSMELASNLGNNFGARIIGYLTVTTTGVYYFWISSNEQSELWLGTSDLAASKRKICYVNGSTGVRIWNKYKSQKSVAISLVAGQRYYIEALMKEGTGADNLAVGWSKPGQVITAPAEIISSPVLSY